MTKEEVRAVNEVKVVKEVVEVMNEYINSKKDIPYERIISIVEQLKKVEEDYKNIINELLLSNALMVKFEQLIELIGTVGTISIENEETLDNTITILNNCIYSSKER